MMITAIICALSVLLFIAYTLGMNRVLKKRMATAPIDAGQPLDEELALDMVEYKENVVKLGTLSAMIGVLTVVSFFII